MSLIYVCLGEGDSTQAGTATKVHSYLDVWEGPSPAHIDDFHRSILAGLNFIVNLHADVINLLKIIFFLEINTLPILELMIFYSAFY